MTDEPERTVVSVIMPAYNEEKRLEACFDRVVGVLKSYGSSFEVILEEDGSTDKTPEIMDKLSESCSYVKALHFPKRMGKGFGVRKCLEAAKGDYIVLIDSDLEYPPEKIPELLNTVDGNDIVVGSRSIWINKKNGNTKLFRAYLSRLYGVLVRWLFGVNLQDYQSGFKAFRRRVIEAIQPLTSDGFEIDSEILIKALQRGLRVGFVPITYTYKGNSKVNVLRDSFKMFLSVLKWKLNGNLGGRERSGSQFKLQGNG